MLDVLTSLNANNKDLVLSIANKCKKLTSEQEAITVMEVCGTHTHAIAKYGLKQLLPSNVNLCSGPGCPVCVTPNELIDKMIAFTKLPNVVVATFGDMIRVPGSSTTLQDSQANGADVRVVYSALDAVDLAVANPNKEIVFIGVGFETTAPTTAAAIIRAKHMKLRNFSVFCAHKKMPAALDFLANSSTLNLDGLLLPGHVSTIIGVAPYGFLANKYNISGCVSGFEAQDIMAAIYLLLVNICEVRQSKPAKIQNAYMRGVKSSGNDAAMQIIDKVFDACSSKWRGLKEIKDSGLMIKSCYKMYDAEAKFDIRTETCNENKSCQCGNVLRGLIRPVECPLFGKVCTPQHPIGPCMVSTEGSCSAYYKYKA